MPAVLQLPGAVKKIEVFLKTLHPKQEEIRQSGAKRKVVKAGRRSGKTFGIAEISVEKFLQAKRVLYAVPTVEQLDKWWFEVTGALRPAVEAGGFYKNETEHFIEKRGTTQRIKGKTAWNPDTLRGDWADLLILDEWQLFDERTWDEVGAPMLLDNDGDAIFLFTPPSMVAEGMSKARDPRHASKLYLKAKIDTTGRWQAFHFTSFDNPHLSKAALDEIATDMSRESFRKEIMADDDELPDHMMVYRAFNAKTQIVPDMVIPAGWPVYCGHDFGCVDTETEILTSRGWRMHDAVMDNESILTLNPRTGFAEWQTIIAMNRYQGQFPMCLIEQRGHNSLTTTNHRWLVQKRQSKKLVFETSETLKANDTVNCAAICSDSPVQAVYRDSFVELVAWFWTEGQIDAGGVSIWQNEGEKAAQIRRCLAAEYGEPIVNTRNGRERAPAGWLERPSRLGQSPRSGLPTGHQVCHFAINLNGAERLVAVAPSRIVKTEFILSLTASQLKLFIETSIKGDGWQRRGRGGKQAGQSLSQSKRVRLEPFQIACTLAGIRTYLHEGEGKSYVSLFKRPKLQIGKACQKHILYEGLVWCPTTPNGTWFARRKGTVFVTGNSANPAAVFLAQNPETGCFFLFKEYLPGGGKSTLQHVQAWQELLRGKAVIRRVGGSHQEDEIRQGYAAHGWPIMEPLHRGRPATVKAAVDRVVSLMEQNKLFIFQSCTFSLSQVLSYAYKLDSTGAVTEEIDNKAKFHLCDALRYIVGDFTPESEGGVRVVSTQVTTGGYQVEVNSPLRVVSTSHA